MRSSWQASSFSNYFNICSTRLCNLPITFLLMMSPVSSDLIIGCVLKVPFRAPRLKRQEVCRFKRRARIMSGIRGKHAVVSFQVLHLDLPGKPPICFYHDAETLQNFSGLLNIFDSCCSTSMEVLCHQYILLATKICGAP